MKKFAFLAVVSLNAFAADFDCRYFYNLEEVYSNTVTVPDGAKNVELAEVDMHKYFMTSLYDGKYELQVLDRIEPSRSYAIAKVSKESPEIGLVIWKREQIVEVSCTLK